jgi:hypothetical protein
MPFTPQQHRRALDLMIANDGSNRWVILIVSRCDGPNQEG